MTPCYPRVPEAHHLSNPRQAKRSGVQSGEGMRGTTTGQYKTYKGLTKESLRDNMTTLELALNTLAEAATTEISRHRNPQTMAENKQVAQSGGNTAKIAREDIERKIGHSVISSEKASDHRLPAEDVEVKEIEE